MGKRNARAALVIAMLLTACAGEQPRHSPTTGTAASSSSPPAVQVDKDPYLQQLYADKRLDPIRDKVPLLLRPDSIKPAHLTNETKPTAAEKKAIVAWLQIRERAQRYLATQRGEPSPLLAQTRNEVTRTIASLHRGELTYGAFARRVRQIDQDYQTAARQGTRQHN